MTNPKTTKRRKRNFTRRRRPNPGFNMKTRSYRRRRSNPNGFSRRRYFARRRRNPILDGLGTTDLFKLGVGAAGGAYGSRALTQLLLQSNNQGWMGYGANILATLALGWAAGKFLGKDFGVGVLAGGFGGVFSRIWSEKVSQTSPSQLSGMGDLDFHGMGDFITSPFALPTVSAPNAGGQYIVQTPPYNYPVAVPAASAGKAVASASMKGLGRALPVARFKPVWAA